MSQDALHQVFGGKRVNRNRAKGGGSGGNGVSAGDGGGVGGGGSLEFLSPVNLVSDITTHPLLPLTRFVDCATSAGKCVYTYLCVCVCVCVCV